MICVSIAKKDAKACIRALSGCEFAEVRIDALENPSENDVAGIFSAKPGMLATCRPGKIAEDARMALLLRAIDSGAGFVDVELEAGENFRRGIILRAKERGCKVIISHHDYSETPSAAMLESIALACIAKGADIAKIACAANSMQDSARLLGLLGKEGVQGRLVVVGMGEAGKITRVAAPLLGSPFTFASLTKGEKTADGQIDAKTLKKIMEVISHG
jgi:3-dehydroquinate dehydratase I